MLRSVLTVTEATLVFRRAQFKSIYILDKFVISFCTKCSES